jgi:hypothetical protein
MLQSIATLVSLAIASGMLALIAGILMEDWRTVTRALGMRRPLPGLPRPARTIGDRPAQVIHVSWQLTPRRAAA